MIIGTPTERMFHVLRHVNNLCAAHATLVRLCIMLLAIAPAVSVASAAEPPTEAAARPAFATARQWVDTFTVPQIETLEAKAPIDGAAGVCIILRRSGRVVGIGGDWTGDDFMLRRAVARALGQLLSEPVMKRMSESARVTVGPLVSIELEIAGTPEPIIARSYEQAGRQLDPGLDGIAMRRERDWQMIFPAQLRANNTAADAHRQYLALAADLSLPAVSLDDLATKHNTIAYRFRAITLAQAEPTDEPFVSVRGEPVVPLSSVTPDAIANWSAQLATHLLSHLSLAQAKDIDPALFRDSEGNVPIAGAPESPPPVGLSGSYNPVADRFNPLVAMPIDQALGAYALEFASHSPRLSPALRARCAAAAQKILHDLADTTIAESSPLESAAACAVLVATISPNQVKIDPTLGPLLDGAIDRLKKAFITTQSFDSSLVSPHERALVAWGIARLCVNDPLTFPRRIADAAIDQVWSETGENHRIALLPWIAWAERDLAGLDAGAPLTHADELHALFTGVFASRVTADNLTSAPDLLGGIPLMIGGRNRATAQSLRPMSWLASAARDPRFVSANDRATRANELREMVRFVRQLMARDETAWRYRNNERALGGIREAAWDLVQPIPAQALGIITLLEAAETLQTAIPEQPAGG